MKGLPNVRRDSNERRLLNANLQLSSVAWCHYIRLLGGLVLRDLQIVCPESKHSNPAFLLALVAFVLVTGCTPGFERRWNEEQARAAIRTIRTAERDFRLRAGKYGSLKDLGVAGLIDSQLASGTKNGFRFELKSDGDSFVATASPLKHRRTGDWYLYLDQTGVIRGTGDGRGSSAQDEPIGNQ